MARRGSTEQSSKRRRTARSVDSEASGDDAAMPVAPVAWLEAMSLLSDPLRLRLLRLLDQHELGVGELARIVQVPQSTVSRHLKPLFESKWLVKRAEGTTSLYRHDPAAMVGPLRQLWELTREQIVTVTAIADDDHRLAQVLAERRGDSAQFFGRIGGDWSQLRGDLFGEGFTDGALLAMIDPGWTVADIGCGTGEATERLAPLVARVIAVDREASMLTAARHRLRGMQNVEFRKGDVHALPIGDAEVDAATAMLLLHHIDDPCAAIAEIARTLRPGGRLLVVDMVAHDREHFRHTMGHRHLGFTPTDVAEWDGCGGLSLRRIHRLRPDTEAKGPGLFAALLIAPESREQSPVAVRRGVAGDRQRLGEHG